MIIKINDIEVKTLLDGGSAVVLLSVELAKSCDLRIHKIKAKLKSAFDQLVSIKGVVYLYYVFQGQEKVVRAYVAGKTSCPLILGSDFFKDNGMVLDHGKNRVCCRTAQNTLLEIDQTVATIHFKEITETEWRARSKTESVGGQEERERPVSSSKTNSRPANKCNTRNGGQSCGIETIPKRIDDDPTPDQNEVDIETTPIAGDACAVELVEDVEEELVASIGEIYGIERSKAKPEIKTYSVEKYFDRKNRVFS